MASARVFATRAPSPHRPVAAPVAVVLGAWLARAQDQILIWLERSYQRRHLGQLSDHMLKDIGLTRADVEAEISKPFWRA